MNELALRAQQTVSPSPSLGILQRKCDCGNHTVAGGECVECRKNKNSLAHQAINQSLGSAGFSPPFIPGMQRKLAIGASNDPLEDEADQIADRILAAPAHRAIGGAAPRIQRRTGSANTQTDSAPKSVDRVLAAAGSPLEASLRQNMEQRFGQDFSRVRIHSDTAAHQSAHDVNASAYTVGHNIVFGASRFSPETEGGRRLLAHELAHVVQQSGQGGNAVGQNAQLDPAADSGRQAVADYRGASSAAGLAIQRKVADDEIKTTVPAAPGVAPGATGPAAVTKPAAKTASVTFIVNYHEVPGTGKDRITPRGTQDALWVNLAVHPFVPKGQDTRIAKGVVSGIGPQPVETMAIPVTEGDSPVGTGSVSPGLKYSALLKTSFDVKVTLPKEAAMHTRAATQVARAFLESTMMIMGDIDDLQTRTVKHLAEKGYTGATVDITTVEAKVSEIGQSTFYYRVHNDSDILMEIEAQPAGEKRADYSKTSGEARNTEQESERHGERKVETTKVEYAKLVVDRLNEYVKRVDDSRSELISNLSDKIVYDDNYKSHEDSKSDSITTETKTDDKKVESHTESGVKDKKNWAAKLKGPLGWLKKAISIPFISKVPFLRRLRTWQLDLIDAGLDLFKEEGKVPYSDTTETTTQKQKTDGSKHTDASDDIVIKANGKANQKRELVETVKTHSESDYKHFKERVESTKEEYSKIIQMESSGGSDRVKENRSTTTSVTVSGSTTWKFSKPVVNATVVAGDAEVSDKALTP